MEKSLFDVCIGIVQVMSEVGAWLNRPIAEGWESPIHILGYGFLIAVTGWKVVRLVI